MQSILMDVDTEIIKLQSEITDYFSNLTNVVDNEFSGKIKIGDSRADNLEKMSIRMFSKLQLMVKFFQVNVTEH